jgi:probable rRNA maturation factor
MSPDGQRGRRPPSLRRRRRTSNGLRVEQARQSTDASAGLAGWLARVAPARARGTVTIAILSDQRVRMLNRKFRGRDAVTDVLSFSGTDNTSTPASAFSAPSASSSFFLGDIAIARGLARRQARLAGHSESTELRVLALHGLLHLLGYDHEHDRGEMRRVEQRLRRKGGLREGLIEREYRARPSAFAEATADRRSAKRGGWSTGSGRAMVAAPHARGELIEPRAGRARAHR